MFNSLYGKITAKLPQTIYLENNGIEWSLLVPESSVNALPHVGEDARIYTHLIHKEDSMTLLGFASLEDRAIFLDLLKVECVGPKGAVKILSNINAKELASVLDSGEVGILEKVPGVGKKTAQKMMLALKGKLTLLDENTGRVKNQKEEAKSPWNDVIMALVDMGYDKKNVEEAIEKIVAKSPNQGGGSKSAYEEKLFRQVIVELAK